MEINMSINWTIGLGIALLFATIITVHYIRHARAKKKIDEEYKIKGIKPVLKELENKKSDSREQAAQLLGEKKERKAVNSLVRIIAEEEDADLLLKAAQALVNMEDGCVTDILISEVKFSDPGNKWWACYVLEKLAEKGLKKDNAVDFLVEAMKQTSKITDAGFPYDSAYEALKNITGEDLGKDVSKWIAWRNSSTG
ncbi:HEAT repeat domain-containing protein [candidate division WOR-3 bacterium]|nr:HEAT repeat domain-containing protein [candidate division WOR-3 bacterium]